MIVGSRPLCDWIIVLFGARNFLGKPSTNGTLSPVYEFRTIVAPQGIVRQVVPVLLYDVSELTLDSTHPRIEINKLPIQEAEILAEAVDICEKSMIELRAQQRGIVTAKTLPDARSPLIMGK